MKLISLYLGTVVVKGKTIKAENKISPGSLGMRLIILPYFLRSKDVCKQPPCIQIIFDSLNGSISDPKLKEHTIEFICHMCAHCPDNLFNMFGPILMTGTVKFIGETKEHPLLRGPAYKAVGVIAKRTPSLVTKDMAILQTFFNNMITVSFT